MKFVHLITVWIISLVYGVNLTAQNTFNNPFSESNKTYIIDSTIDLRGQTLQLPSCCELLFKKKGLIKNGTLVGDDTKVSSCKHLIFCQMVLRGSFKADKAYSEWFDLESDCILDDHNKYISGTNNIQGFRNLLLFNNVSIKPGCYMIEGVLNCRSNQVINGNNATLKFLTKKFCVNIDGTGTIPIKNVTIRNLSIIGCKQEYDDVTEWWHGVNIGFAKNVLIDNVTCKQCRGDGFYIGTRITEVKNVRIPEDITLNRVKASHNYRNGLSITRIINATVSNSVFCYTTGALPETGLDIEPNRARNNEGGLIVGECENIRITKCKFYNNGKEGFLIANQISTKPSIRIIKNVYVADCDFDDDDITLTGCADCKLEKLSLKNSIVKINGESIIRNLTLSKFKIIETEEDNDKTAIELVNIKHWPVRSNIVISDMTVRGYGGAAIKVGKGSSPLAEKKFDGLSITGCRIKNCGKGIEIGNNSTNNLELNDNRVDGKLVKSTQTYKTGICFFSFLFLAGCALYFIHSKRF